MVLPRAEVFPNEGNGWMGHDIIKKAFTTLWFLLLGIVGKFQTASQNKAT